MGSVCVLLWERAAVSVSEPSSCTDKVSAGNLVEPAALVKN